MLVKLLKTMNFNFKSISIGKISNENLDSKSRRTHYKTLNIYLKYSEKGINSY